MKRTYITIFILTLSVNLSFGGEDKPSSGFSLFPEGHLFAPLRTNLGEPDVGVFKFLDGPDMKVSIGNAIDVFGFNSENFRLTAGIDFLAYAFTTGSQGLRLQVDALDGFFGGDLSGIYSLNADARLQARLRILHQSAHMVDGHYLSATNSWLGNRPPVPFTRDFGELTIAPILHHPFGGNLRPYAGLSYATLVRPTAIRRFAFLAGCEMETDRLLGPVAGKPTNVFLAYHLDLTGYPAYTSTHELLFGVKFGKWFERGVSIYGEYYTGRHIFSEYLDQRLRTFGVGFTVDFF